MKIYITITLWATLLLGLTSCASLPLRPQPESSLAYAVEDGSGLLQRHAPVFIIEEPEKEYNRLGTPMATFEDEVIKIGIDPSAATIYTSVRQFTTKKDSYTNLFYRLHFQGIPYGFIPFYLGSGENVGLLVVVTLDNQNNPVLYTLLHTCGCYLSFIPTSFLPADKFIPGWQKGRQGVFSENLPGFLDFSALSNEGKKVFVHLRSATHRVKNIWLSTQGDLHNYKLDYAALQPFAALEKLVLPDGQTTSFFETSGPRMDYVKGAQKIWERLFISWWAFDWRVGEDKKLGEGLADGPVFYTSLKPWAREQSDLRDFAGFLRYWGWRL